MPFDHGGFMPASALDPYTRLLASLADAVTKARQSMHTITLIIIACSILFVAGITLLFTSFLWVPALFIFCFISIVGRMCRLSLTYGEHGVRKVRDKTRMWINLVFNQHAKRNASRASDERHLRTQLAMKDQSFMRAIFQTLPGVDPDSALKRVDRLRMCQLASAAVDQSPAAARGGYSSRSLFSQSSFSEDDHSTDDDYIAQCVSPIQQLFAKGLLESEEQASWQAGRAFAMSPEVLDWTIEHVRDAIEHEAKSSPS